MRSLFGSIVFLLVVSRSIVSAEPVIWQLQNVSFDDGGSASGVFVYDADLQDFSYWNIATTEGVRSNGKGGPLSGFIYNQFTSSAQISPVCSVAFLVDPNPVHVLCLNLSSPLDVGGDHLLEDSFEGFGDGSRVVLEGATDPSEPLAKKPFIRQGCGGGCTIPEPSTITLFAIAIGLSFAFRHFLLKNI